MASSELVFTSKCVTLQDMLIAFAYMEVRCGLRIVQTPGVLPERDLSCSTSFFVSPRIKIYTALSVLIVGSCLAQYILSHISCTQTYSPR